ncbi:MAG: nitrite reductase small subunit NirD [Candidatus Tectomicrobia bacterium]
MNGPLPKRAQWTLVCRVEDILPDTGVCALVNNEQVAVFRISGSETLYAISAEDPFSDAPVLARGIVGDINGELVVASPIYKHHFNLSTGQCIEDASVRVKSYAVRVAQDWVLVAFEKT